MPAKKVTSALLTDIEAAERHNYTSVPALHAGGKRKVGLVQLLLSRYYVETCLYAVEKWELYATNIVGVAIFFFLAKSLYTLAQLTVESAQELF